MKTFRLRRPLALAVLLVTSGLASAVEAVPKGGPRPIAPRLSMSEAMTLPRLEVLHQRHPAVAYGNGVYLIVWQEGYNGLGGNSDVLGLRLDEAGRWLDKQPITICTEASVQDSPAVAYSSGQFLVAWSDLRNGKDYDVYATLVDPEGRVKARNGFLVSGGRGGQANPAVAGSDSGTFLAVWQDFRGGERFQIYGARLSAKTSAVLDKDGFEALAAGEVPAVTWTGTHFLVCQRWYARLFGDDGRPVAPAVRAWNSKTVLLPAVTSAWGKGFVFFNTEPQQDPWGWGGNGAIIGASVTPAGTSPEWGQAGSLRSLSSKEADGRIRNCLDAARWRNHTGWPMGMPGGFKGTHEGTWPSGRLAAAFNGRSLVVVWNRAHVVDRRRLRNRDLYLTRVLDGWAMVDRPKLKIVAGPTEEVFPVLAAGSAGNVLLAYEREEPTGGIGIQYRRLREDEDRQPPRITAISRWSDERMIVGFDEPIDPASAARTGNYRIDGITVRSATFNEDNRALQREVILETAPQTRGKTYVLRIKGVRDRSSNRNATTGEPFTYLCKPGTSERSDFIARWTVIGPFPNNWDVDHVGAPTVQPSPGDKVPARSPAETKATLRQVIPAARWADEDWDAKVDQHFLGERQWQAVECAGGCVLDISRRHGRIPMAAIYANTYVFSDRQRDVLVRLDTNDGNRVWLNGTVLAFNPTRERTRGFHDYTNEVPARLKKGWNQLLVQVENRHGAWQMSAQLTDPTRQSIRPLTFQLENPFR